MGGRGGMRPLRGWTGGAEWDAREAAKRGGERDGSVATGSDHAPILPGGGQAVPVSQTLEGGGPASELLPAFRAQRMGALGGRGLAANGADAGLVSAPGQQSLAEGTGFSTITRHAPAFLAVILVALVPTRPCWSAELTPSEVARALDITSFRNSTRPGLRPGTKTLAQNGFTVVEPAKGDTRSVEVYLPDHSWLYEITVLRSEGAKAVVCILDQALNGGTYLTQVPLELRRGGDGLLHATGRAVSDPHCDKFAR